jgi:hypothetical protein
MYYFLKMQKLFFATKNTHEEKIELREEWNRCLNLAAGMKLVDRLTG